MYDAIQRPPSYQRPPRLPAPASSGPRVFRPPASSLLIIRCIQSECNLRFPTALLLLPVLPPHVLLLLPVLPPHNSRQACTCAS